MLVPTCRNYENARRSNSLVALLLSFCYKIILIVVRLNDTFLIHENSHFVFFFSLLLMPVFGHAIKRIP